MKLPCFGACFRNTQFLRRRERPNGFLPVTTEDGEAFRSYSPAAKLQATPPTSGRKKSRAPTDASKVPEADVRSMRRIVGAMGVASSSPNHRPSFSLLPPPYSAPGLAQRPTRCACAIEPVGGGRAVLFHPGTWQPMAVVSLKLESEETLRGVTPGSRILPG